MFLFLRIGSLSIYPCVFFFCEDSLDLTSFFFGVFYSLLVVYFLSALAYLLFVFLRGVDFEDNALDDFLEALDSGLES